MENKSTTPSSLSDSPSDEIHSRPAVLITGGSAGIGLATACRFAANGYNVLICGRDQARLDLALEKIQAMEDGPCTLIAVRCDLAEPGAAQALIDVAIERLGKIDVLVNNAGVAPLSPLDETSDEVFENTIQVNVRSVFYATRDVWKHMKEQGSGVVVNISSLAAVDPFPGFSLYGATKAWVDLMTTALVSEGSEHGIRVYSVRPGAVETDLLRGLFPDFPADQCVTPAEVAEKVWECVSQPDSHASGQHFPVTKQTS